MTKEVIKIAEEEATQIKEAVQQLKSPPNLDLTTRLKREQEYAQAVAETVLNRLSAAAFLS